MKEYDITKGSVVEVTKPLNGFSENWKGRVSRVLEDIDKYEDKIKNKTSDERLDELLSLDEPVVFVQKGGSVEVVPYSYCELIN